MRFAGASNPLISQTLGMCFGATFGADYEGSRDFWVGPLQSTKTTLATEPARKESTSLATDASTLG